MPLARSRWLIASGLALLVAGSARGDCAQWPGEPGPLPQLGSDDPVLERWALLRREELRGLALLLEASDPLEARRLWLHAACIAPGDLEIAAALARSARPVVHRVEIEPGAPVSAGRRATLGAAFETLDRAARVPAQREPEAPQSERFDFASVDARIETAALHLGEARFEAAAQQADLARARLARLASTQPVRERRVRIELLAATARIALGELDDARSCIERALGARPDLTLDADTAPPKLQRLFDETRAQLAQRQE